MSSRNGKYPSNEEWLDLQPGAPCGRCGEKVYRLVEGLCIGCDRRAKALIATEIEQRQVISTLRRNILGEKRRKERQVKAYWDQKESG